MKKRVYLLTVWSYAGWPLFIAKAGISHNEAIRAADVERSIWQTTGRQVRVRPFFAVTLFMFADVERVLLLMTRRLRCHRFRGASGWTEFVYTANPLTAILAGLMSWWLGFDAIGWAALSMFFMPFPLDLALALGAFALLDIVVCILLPWLFNIALFVGGVYAAASLLSILADIAL